MSEFEEKQKALAIVLHDKLLAQMLLDTAEVAHMDENILFLMAMTDYRKYAKGAEPIHDLWTVDDISLDAARSDVSIMRIGSWIYVHFISQLAPKQVNLPDIIIDPLQEKSKMQMAELGFTPKDFVPAYDEIANLVLLQGIGRTILGLAAPRRRR